MARLMFVSEGERNNDERGETSSLSKATNNNYVTNDKGEKAEDQRQSSSSPSNDDSESLTNLMGESMVARLASKFDANNTTVVRVHTSKSSLESENKINAYKSSNGVTVVPIRMSSSPPATPESNATNSSVLETIQFFEKQSSSKKQRTSSSRRVVKIATRNHAGSRFKTIDITKPSIRPKPVTAAVVKRHKSSIQQAPEIRIETSENLHHYAVKLSTTHKENNATEYLSLSTVKNQRLSIAKDFSLEGVLNDGGNENEGGVISNHTRNELESQAGKTANASFLHKYLEQCVESKKTDANAVDSSTDDSSDIYSTVNENESSLHDRLSNELKNDDDENGVYEDMPGSTDENTTGVGHHHYAVIKTAGNNIYDELVYSNLRNRHDEEEAENYEVISSRGYGNNSKENLPPTESATRSSDSDCSLEQANSLYGLKPNSNFSSATTSTFSSSNDCINIKIESPYMFVGEKSSCSDVSDELITDDWDSDEDENRREIIVYTKWLHLSRLRKLKFLLRSKGHEGPPVVDTTNCCMDDLCDDFDDSSSDLEESETDYQFNKSQPAHSGQTQSIYGLVEKARKSVLNWSSVNYIRKMGANIANNFPAKSQDNISSHRSKSMSAEEINEKNGHSTVNSGNSARWLPFKDKNAKHSARNSTSSIFYLNPEDICFSGRNSTLRNEKNVNANDRRKQTTIKLQPTRPTSPPPPPPPLPFDKQKSNEFKNTDSSPPSNIDSDRSSCSYESRNSLNGSEVTFDGNRSESDLHLRFADEPLYQFYAESVAELTTNTSIGSFTDSDGYEEIASNASRPSAMELITPSPNGHGQYRSLWCEVDEVRNSGILETLSPSKQRLQEAIFEIITSEASYYKSLSVLDKIFVTNAELKNESVLKKNDWKVLFGNVAAVRKCSEKLLAALEKCWQDSILLTGLCDVLYKHASENFRIYVKYCSNQIYIDRTLKSLKERNSRFVEIVSQLEANPMCQSLSLHSFLMLPMQRITRMPLLLDAVLSRMNNSIADDAVYKTYQITLATINKIVNECNETARKLERYEEMLLLSGQLEFSKKDVKMFSVASSSRWLIRSGPMVHINPQDIKLTLTRKFTKQTTKYYFFLFNDILVVAKKKSEDTYVVFDYCARSMLQMSLPDDDNISPYKYLLLLTMLENHEGKTVEMILSCDSDSTRQRWIEATSSYLTSDNPEEKLYEEWDCPQVCAIHAYTAIQPDELSLQAGDTVKVLKKTSDGWYHGERIRDGVTGWFPGNYTVEIASQHMRAKNLKLRHRLLTLSGNYLQFQLQKKN